MDTGITHNVAVARTVVCVTDIEAGIDVDVPCKPSILKSNYNHIFCELLDKGSSAN